MLFTPFNFTFSLQRLAIYEWEPIQPADSDTPAPMPAACEDAQAQAQQQPEGTTPPGMELVFKGYEWASVANCGLFPRASIEDCYTGGSDLANAQADSSEKESRTRQNDVMRRPKPAMAVPDQTNAPDGPCSTPAPHDPLKSRQP